MNWRWINSDCSMSRIKRENTYVSYYLAVVPQQQLKLEQLESTDVIAIAFKKILQNSRDQLKLKY